jgi:hypothetical protein
VEIILVLPLGPKYVVLSHNDDLTFKFSNTILKNNFLYKYVVPWKRIGGVDLKLHAFLTSALYGGEWSASRHSRFACGEGVPGTHWIGGWVGPVASLDTLTKRKIIVITPAGNWTPIVHRVAMSLYWLSYRGCGKYLWRWECSLLVWECRNWR